MATIEILFFKVVGASLLRPSTSLQIKSDEFSQLNPEEVVKHARFTIVGQSDYTSTTIPVGSYSTTSTVGKLLKHAS